MGLNKLRKFYSILNITFDHCLSSQNDAGLLHDDDGLIFVAETGLLTVKAEVGMGLLGIGNSWEI